jgi:hypothetical protein
MRKPKLLILSIVLIAAVLAVVAYFSVLYWRGGSGNYEPPKQTYASPQERVQADLQNLSRAVEAYFIKNMEYPGKLELLQPEFLDHVANDPLSGKAYLYTLNESEGAGRYRIGVPDPKLYDAKEFYIEDGKIVRK